MKIYTSAEISEGRIPKDNAQAHIRKRLVEQFDLMYPLISDTLSAAVLIGSSARGEATVTSDMDVLLFLEDGYRYRERMKDLIPFLSSVRAESRALFVPLEFYAVLKSQTDPTQKRYDKQFLRHAVWALDWNGLLGGEGAAVKHFYDLCPELELATALTYIDRKVAKAESSLLYAESLTDEESVRLYADLVNSPFHALRRAFTLGKAPYVDNRDGLISSLRDIGDELTEENLRYLRRLGNEYREYVLRKRDKLPAARDPFTSYGPHRIAGEFFTAMARIREYAIATAPA